MERKLLLAGATSLWCALTSVSSLALAQEAPDAKPNSGSSDSAPQKASEKQGSAVVPTPDSGAAAPASDGTQHNNGGAGDIIITAEKRKERLQDTPVAVTALTAQDLTTNNQLRLAEYYSQIPALNIEPGFGGQPVLTIRGINSGGGNATVGVLVDGVPIGGSTYFNATTQIPEIDPSDLQRVEVLKGPQGTLYGNSSIGGIVNYVTQDPSFTSFRGRLQTGLAHIENSHGELGYNISGSINVPVSPKLAVIVSGFARKDAGYVDNVNSGQKGVNDNRVEGARVAVLWRPTDNFSWKISAIYQRDQQGSIGVVNTALGDLKTDELPGSTRYQETTKILASTMSLKLGPSTLESITGYSDNHFISGADFSFFGPFIGLPDSYAGYSGIADRNDEETKKFSEELRWTWHLGRRVDWLIGAFYTHEDSPYVQYWYAENPTNGQPITTQPATLLTFPQPSTLTEYAAFSNLTVRPTDRLELQAGIRADVNRQTMKARSSGYISGLFFGGDPSIQPDAHSRQSATTYLITAKYNFAKDVMAYARLATGFRAGGPNPNAALLGLPPTFEPDTTTDYEIGMKAYFFDHKLYLDGDAYYTAWKNIALGLVTPQSNGYLANAGAARSKGFELAANVEPIQGLHLSGWVALTDAVLTKPFPSNAQAYGVPGNPLPGSSRWSEHASVDYRWPLFGLWDADVAGQFSKVGGRYGGFTPSPLIERTYLPGYLQADLSAGITNRSWTVRLYVNNITDKRGSLSGSPQGGNTQFVFIPPRTAGFNIIKTF
jgi:outer membrane receptor protein involved in Fe transport